MATATTPASCTFFAPGVTFCPPEDELTDRYLHRELAGNPVPGTLGFVHHVDIYSADPEHLVEKLAPAPGTGKGDKPPVWYFFSPVRSAGGRKTTGGRKARAVVGGTWHGEGTKAVKGSQLGGTVRTFTYARKSASGEGGVERLGWIMKEYDVAAQNGGGDRLLCKIYRTPRKKSSSATTSSSSSSSSKKRKAASDHPDAPMPSARRTGEENVGHVFMKGSGESESQHYGAPAFYYGGTATTYVHGGETVELAPCAQESFLPSSSELYGTTDTHQGVHIDDDIAELLFKLPTDAELADFQEASEEDIQALMLELSQMSAQRSMLS